MSFISFFHAEIDQENQLLKDKGYWYHHTYDSRWKFYYKPLHKRAQTLMIAMKVWPIVSILSIALFSTALSSQFGGREYLIPIVILGPLLVIRLLLWGKVYGGNRKQYLEQKGKTDNLYTSELSLLTTEHEGTYVCKTCQNMLATTDAKRRVDTREVIVDTIIAENIAETSGSLVCNVCETKIGRYMDSFYYLDGDAIGLDTNELHLIYS